MRAYVGLGSNLGERLDNLEAALRVLDVLEGTDVHAVSHVYESRPWPTSDQPLYANAVAVVDTHMRADDLLAVLKQIEADMGRQPAVRNAPRVIDLDILLADDEEWETPDLVIPHPRMLERQFVVMPLLDVDPHVRMPDGSPVTDEAATQGRVVEMLGALPGFEDRTWGEPMRVAGAVAPRPVVPDEEWIPVWERPGYNPVFTAPSVMANGLGTASGRYVPGNMPSFEASFIQLVLEQLGIPFAWDPFPPEKSSDPYMMSRPFTLLVPKSMAEEAWRAIEEAASAPIDWSDAPE